MESLQTLIDSKTQLNEIIPDNKKRVHSILSRMGRSISAAFGLQGNKKRAKLEEYETVVLSTPSERRRTRSLTPPRNNVSTPSRTPCSISTQRTQTTTSSIRSGSVSTLTDTEPYNIGVTNGIVPTINFLGFRKLSTTNKLSLDIGDSVIIVLPQSDNKNPSIPLEIFRKRLQSHIVKARSDDFRRTPASERPKLLETIIDTNHQIIRGNTICHEYIVTVTKYPNRCYYHDPNFRQELVHGNFSQGGGIEFSMNLYPNNSSLLCKFYEFTDVEMWRACNCNDRKLC